eukprot:TRINITY_DN5801_c1_g1_i1.p1 TRINITY_DN5801_c1_g1~~TRINITY_DN5801_c1_g1_i1.p1  ORF type:complete len:261 (-),score=62.33 TRINITY_DN5801_c1_g1_i1:62-844(-)
MAVGKVKKSGKPVTASKKGGKKKVVDPFTRKEWYDLKAPSYFSNRQIGKTCVNKTVGTKIASDSLRNRVVEVTLAELNNTEEAWRKFKLRVEDIQGTNCLTNFYGMDMTSDKHHSLIRKWQSLIEAQIDVRTTDGYLLRLFAIAFTEKRDNQFKRTSYAQTAQIRAVRKKVFDIIIREASTCELKDLVAKFVAGSISNDIVKETQMIFPLTNVHIRKVKVLKTPKFDAYKLSELHGDLSSEDKGHAVEAPVAEVAPEQTA